MIDISEYKKIYVNLENFYTNLTSSASTSFDIALLKAANTINNQTGFGSSNITRILNYSGSAVNRPATCTLEASLTSYTGNYYIGIESIGRSSDHTIQFDIINIYLEK